jgi:hypothetical protein
MSELEWVRKEVVVTYFKSVSGHFPRGTEESHGNFSQDSRSPGRYVNPPDISSSGNRSKEAFGLPFTSSPPVNPLSHSPPSETCILRHRLNKLHIHHIIYCVMWAYQSHHNVYSVSQTEQSILYNIVYHSLSQSFYPGGTFEIIFRSQGTPA